MEELKKRKVWDAFDLEEEYTRQPNRFKAPTHEKCISCPSSKISLLMGPEGSVIKEIQRRCDCKIAVDRSLPNEAKVRFYDGTPEDMEEAKELVLQVIHQDDSSLNTLHMECPLDRVGVLIGARGQVIQDLRRRTGTVIKVHPVCPGLATRKVTVVGSVNQLREAKSLILAVIEKGPQVLSLASSSIHGDQPFNLDTKEVDLFAYEMNIPKDKVATVIGSKGRVLSEITARTKCKLVIDQSVPEEQLPKVIIQGSRDGIRKASALIGEILLDGPKALTVTSSYSEEISIHSNQVGRIMGPRGSTIKKIQRECGVKMVVYENFAGRDEWNIRFTGESNSVKEALDLTSQVLGMGEEHHFLNARSKERHSIPYASTASYSEENEFFKRELSKNFVSKEHLRPTHFPANSLSLGADGSAGVLLPAEILSDGMKNQVAYRSLLVNNFSHSRVGCLSTI